MSKPPTRRISQASALASDKLPSEAVPSRGQREVADFPDFKPRVKPECSLAALCPKVAREWDKNRNGKFSPYWIGPFSPLHAWWKCSLNKDHVWKATVVNRVGLGRGCPYCANLKVDATNMLVTVNPGLAAQWHPVKNGKLKPSDVVPGSPKIVWWKCKNVPDHEWRAGIKDRSRGNGCPFCANKKVCWSNCLANLHPEIARQWHEEKNGTLKPSDIVAGSHTKVWWRCDKSEHHDWLAGVGKRVAGSGCPYCARTCVAADTSLAYKYPLVAHQWHPKLNGKLKPSDVMPRSDKKVWWRCLVAKNHVWEASVANVVRSRLLLSTGCPFCAKAETILRMKRMSRSGERGRR